MCLAIYRSLTPPQLSLDKRLMVPVDGGRMYEAPDRYKRLVSARLPGGESAGARGPARPKSESIPATRRSADFSGSARALLRGCEHCRRAHHGRQSLGAVSPTWLLPWVVAVAVVNLGAMQLARHPGDHLRRPVGEASADVVSRRRGGDSCRHLPRTPALPFPRPRSAHPGDRRIRDGGRGRRRGSGSSLSRSAQ